jgi:hypothetical protein
MRNIIFCICLIVCIGGCSDGSGDHPRIYITDKKKEQFAEKLATVDWAKESYEKLKAGVEPYVDRHKTDPEWIVSRLQMYWDTHYERVYVNGHVYTHGTGHAPVPTVKFAGHRDGATDYQMPSLEDTQPYMDEKGMYLQNMKKEGHPWEWVHPSKTGRMIGPMNARIMSLAGDAAFLYWYTGEEKYAVFASDIFLTYVKGMHYRREPFALENYTNSHLMGLATFEVILDNVISPMATCYDFLYKYLKKHDADMDMIADVFKRFAEQEIMYGVPDNNWNIFQARYVAYLALALEDDSHYKDRRGRQYYINEIMNHTTIRQFSLKESVVDLFDQETGIWPESATYSMSVCNDMLDVISLIDNAENNHLLDTFPIMKKAVPATAQYLFPNGRVTAFGDAKYATLNPRPYEMLISLYRKYGEIEMEQELTQVLQKMINDGVYNRNENKSLFSLVFYVDKLPELSGGKEPGYSHFQSDTYYAPNVSWLIQRNGRDKNNGMVTTLTGAFGNHAHANGISMEMYGKGLLLAPEGSNGETYGTSDHNEYYARFTAHNTVIVDGISDYGAMRSYAPYQLLSCYPAHGRLLEPWDQVSFSRVQLTEPKTDALQERLTSIVRTGETDAYVVDIFRSARKDHNDKKHEYLYHSIGQSIDLFYRSGQSLSLTPTRELSSAEGDMKGYDYFTNKKALPFEQDFRARFRIESEQQENVFVDLWMKGYPGRTLFTVDAPKSNALVKGSVPDDLVDKPLPTLIVRQKGEAWNRPFASVYHPYFAKDGASVKSVEYLYSGESVFITVQSANRKDYILSGPFGNSGIATGDVLIKGVYGVAGVSDDGLNLFISEGEIKKGYWRIETKEPGAQASLNRTGKITNLVASGSIRLSVPVEDGRQPEVSNLSNPDEKFGWIADGNLILSIDLSAGRYQIK